MLIDDVEDDYDDDDVKNIQTHSHRHTHPTNT